MQINLKSLKTFLLFLKLVAASFKKTKLPSPFLIVLHAGDTLEVSCKTDNSLQLSFGTSIEENLPNFVELIVLEGQKWKSYLFWILVTRAVKNELPGKDHLKVLIIDHTIVLRVLKSIPEEYRLKTFILLLILQCDLIMHPKAVASKPNVPWPVQNELSCEDC